MNLKKFALKDYFNDNITLKDFHIDSINRKTILIYDISQKTLIGPKPLRIRFDKLDGFIRIYNGTVHEKYDELDILYRIRYLISRKSGIAYMFSRYYAKIKVDSYSYLPIRENIDFA